jgi:hypothetical protein
MRRRTEASNTGICDAGVEHLGSGK